MKIEEAITFFSSLTDDERKKFLAHFSHWLTVIARDSYETGTENFTNQPRMRYVNEIQHQISSYLLALLENNSERYPDDILMQIILEHSDDKEFERQVIRAFEKVAARFPVAV